MRLRFAARAALVFGAASVAAVAACKGTVVLDEQEQGGGGAGGSLPPGCESPASTPPPYAVTFHFVNDSAEPRYLHIGCALEMSVTSCADGYLDGLTLSGECTVDCSDPPGSCIACGACMDFGQLVPPGGSYDQAWAGLYYTFGTLQGCSCHVEHVAPAGKYRVAVPVWVADPTGGMAPPPTTVLTDFTLPTAGGVVTVSIGP
ncbi:MAG: hypothetical protein IT373_29990 [Polyangiaceae bacterium]|nr:hypothetical protein [Polyangiaceae bacterium]